MRRSKRIEPLQELSNTKANELSQGVAQAAELLATKEAQLRQLQAYREDYLRRSSGTASGTDPMLLQNFRAFLERLGEAIRLQAQAVEVARGDYETKRSAWAAVRVEAAALGKAVDRFRAEERRASERQEQALSDESAQQLAQSAPKDLT